MAMGRRASSTARGSGVSETLCRPGQIRTRVTPLLRGCKGQAYTRAINHRVSHVGVQGTQDKAEKETRKTFRSRC